MRKILSGLEKWGHYLLAALCAAVILLSALWTRDQMAAEAPESQALSDQSQHMSDVTPVPEALALTRPVDAAVLVSYSGAPAYCPETGVWQAHPFVDFAAAEGQAVRAMLPGVVLSCDGDVLIDHGDGVVAGYRGIAALSVRPGQAVQAGDVLGAATRGTDGVSVIRVWLRQDGESLPFGMEWVDNPPELSYNTDNDQIGGSF